MRRLASRVRVALHRVCAAILVVAMLAMSPASLPSSCDRCPPDCPMHARAQDADADRHALPCHSGQLARPADDEAPCVLRAGCGHESTVLASMPLRILLTDVAEPGRTLGSDPLDPDTWRPARAGSSEPPTAPPRTIVG